MPYATWSMTRIRKNGACFIAFVYAIQGRTTNQRHARGPSAHGMKLERASARFHNHKEGGLPAYRLMQEEECSLVVTIKVGNLEEENTWNHFVAWDGKVIYNSPHHCKVNLTSNRTKEGSKAVFKKLFSEKEFSSRDVCAVFELQCYLPSKS